MQLPCIAQAQRNTQRTAATDANGSATYAQLLDASARVASVLLAAAQAKDLNEARIAFLLAPGIPWIATLWGVWRAGGVAVPLPLGAAQPELEYVLQDTGALIVVCGAVTAEMLQPIAAISDVQLIRFESVAAAESMALPVVGIERRAMILYTSGTTSRPKGVVTTHLNIMAQITSLIEAWAWSADDRIVLCLPLHHVHGIINVVSCALWAGAKVELLPRFDAAVIWELIVRGALTIFMAVPTIYVRLIAAWEEATPERQAEWSAACARLQLMVSGSAALPVSTLERWRAITGHTLLERYGMTEIGMALSNPLHGERVPGSVGRPLPGVAVQLVDDTGEPVPEGITGEIEVRGPNVFLEYWQRPEATREAFRNGWFRTGDTAVVERGVYRILGRTSIDILKTGGHKVSALEIEEVLRQHAAVAECAVVGVPDAEWGERIAVALVLHAGTSLDLEALRGWGRALLTAHKLPTRLLVLEALPRNAMGKVVKPAVTKLFAEKNDTVG